MDTEELHKQIDEKRRILQGLQDTSEKIIPEMVRIITSYSLCFTDYIINHVKTEMPDIIMSMGKENLSQLIKDIESAKSNYPEIINKFVDEIDWPHKRNIPESNQSAMDLNQYINTSLDNVIRTTVGEVGTILMKYKCTEYKGSISEWKSDGKGRMTYAYGLPKLEIQSEKEYVTIKQQYNDLYKKQIPIIMELSKLIQEDKRKMADNLWEQA
jgi:hypothetical protein